MAITGGFLIWSAFRSGWVAALGGDYPVRGGDVNGITACEEAYRDFLQNLEMPADLYAAAMHATHATGADWTDPRSGITYPAPVKDASEGWPDHAPITFDGEVRWPKK